MYSLCMDRQQILERIGDGGVHVCAVTKTRSVSEVEGLLREMPEVDSIGENRWPDCEEKFLYFKDIEKHFIGPLQSNKVRKVLPLVDVVQSVDSMKLLRRIDVVAGELGKVVDFTFQVNVSEDPLKRGIEPGDLGDVIEEYLGAGLKNVRLIGLMTIGRNCEVSERKKYFKEFKSLFDGINSKYFKDNPLPILSMGMSSDYVEAIEAGATMIRIGSCLF